MSTKTKLSICCDLCARTSTLFDDMVQAESCGWRVVEILEHDGDSSPVPRHLCPACASAIRKSAI